MIAFNKPPLPPASRRLLNQSLLLCTLEPELREELIELGSLQTWKRGTYLFDEDSPIRHFFLLLAGKVREYYCGSSGTEYLRRLARPGAYIGLHSAFSKRDHYSHRCQALTAVTTFTWPTEPFMEYLGRHPDIGLTVSAILADHFEHSCRRNCLCRKPTARGRVAGYLLSRLCRQCRRQWGCPADTGREHFLDLWPLTHAAEDINLTREAFSRALSSLQKEGILRCDNGKITIFDIEALKAISGAD
ncbi:MAG: Crp/Fnr family transcriptional regulator [Desulfobulbus sp.]|jgi:CRP-like cAMP-binding protein